jgi:hypothetical protein
MGKRKYFTHRAAGRRVQRTSLPATGKQRVAPQIVQRIANLGKCVRRNRLIRRNRVERRKKQLLANSAYAPQRGGSQPRTGGNRSQVWQLSLAIPPVHLLGALQMHAPLLAGSTGTSPDERISPVHDKPGLRR